MPADGSSDVKFEIGHVLFIDIVGYSKLLITEQSERLQGGNTVVGNNKRLSPTFHARNFKFSEMLAWRSLRKK